MFVATRAFFSTWGKTWLLSHIIPFPYCRYLAYLSGHDAIQCPQCLDPSLFSSHTSRIEFAYPNISYPIGKDMHIQLYDFQWDMISLDIHIL
ncbi:hypothetical protein CK203_090241 [Vitis vinifera]|uniref:Uncharacterized protein n=1 Tax=Vitis vinifera TaxID=29760 RepID=A0A438CIS4_VITVI|nr:hypothetical protein CK203_090241 [Vitis vinifera]